MQNKQVNYIIQKCSNFHFLVKKEYWVRVEIGALANLDGALFSA